MWRLLLAFGTIALLPTFRALDYEWYVSANGSGDVTTCGRTPVNPCRSLTDILSYSPSFSNASVRCYMTGGAVDGWDSTTVYFIGETNVVPAVCMRNWTNLRIVGLHERSTVLVENSGGGCTGYFEFIQCANVSIENINFAFSGIGRTTLLFEASQDVQVTGCSFPVTAVASGGVWLKQCSGDIILHNNTFHGDSEQSTRKETRPRALDVLHGCVDYGDCDDLSSCVQPFDMDPLSFADLSFTLTISQCEFRNLANLNEPEDDYSRASKGFVAMRVQFGSYSANNRLYVRDSVFRNIVNKQSNGVVVSFLGQPLSGEGSFNNTVLFSGCTFRDNIVRYGGGFSTYFITGPTHSSVTVEDCEFIDNVADYEGGGIFSAFLSSGSTNSITAVNSIFRKNFAQAGGAIFIINNAHWFTARGIYDLLSRSVVVRASLTDCSFEGNTADASMGVVDVLRVHLDIYGVSNFTESLGSAILLRLSFLTMEGEFTFSRNNGGSGGAISIREGSRVNMTDVREGYFVNNSASFQGGAIYADRDSTTELFTEYNHTNQLLFSSCSILFGNEFRNIVTTRLPRRFSFIGNTAIFEGQHIYSFSLRSCITSNFVPSAIDHFFAFPNDGTVYHEVSVNRDPLHSTTTGPNFLFFRGASVKCLKRVSNTAYLLPNCSNDLLQLTFNNNKDLNCSILAMTEELRHIYGMPGTGLRPTTDNLVAPWASIDASWMNPPKEDRQQCPEPNPGNIYLSPAPGEEFDISILLADQLLNYILDTVYMQVTELDDAHQIEALIQLNGLQYGVGERVYFTPNRPLAGMALVGMPGAEGLLKVTAESQIQDQLVVLHIPFQLSQCPLGYFLPKALRNYSLTQELIYSSVTQRIPSNSSLSCHCFKEDPSLVMYSKLLRKYESECIQGYTVELSRSVWGGLFSADGEVLDDFYPPTMPCPSTEFSTNVTYLDNLTNFVLEFRKLDEMNQELHFDPVDVVSYLDLIAPGGGAPVMCFNKTVEDVVNHKSKGVFAIEQCGQGFCQGDGRDTWLVANVSFPCAENRMGPLCGQCKPNYSVTLYSTRCVDCTGKPYQYYLSLFFTLSFGLILVVLVLVFNIGATPTVDSFLFFIQSVHLVLAGRNDYEFYNFLAFFNPNFTFNLCVIPNLTALIRLILQYATPSYILILLVITLALTKFKYFAKIMGRHSILQGLWLLFLISYFNIIITSFEILYCGQLGPVQLDGVDQNRGSFLVQDPSIRCYRGLHLLFTIIALVILLLSIMPLLVFLFAVTRKSRWKPIADVFSSCYRDNRRWWIVLSLFRRLLLVLFGVFLQDVSYRHFFLILCIVWILGCQVLTWPYRNRIDNVFAVYVIWKLLIVAILTQPETYLIFDLGRVPSIFAVIFTILWGLFFILQEILIRLLAKKSVGRFYETTVWPKLKRYKKKIANDLRMNKNRTFELEESTKSTASTIIPAKVMIDATAYREPLLDSQYSNSVEDSQFTRWEGKAITSSSMKSAPSVNSSQSYFFKKKKFDEPQDEVHEEGTVSSVYEPPTTTDCHWR